MTQLNTLERDEFIFLQRSLILFVNRQLGLYPKFKTAIDLAHFKEEDMMKGLIPIREKMYSLDMLTLFCQQESITELQKNTVMAWQYVYSDDFYVFKYLKDYAVLLTKDEKKLYGVIGVSHPLEDLIPGYCLPTFVTLKLIPFNGKIIFDSFFAHHNVMFGGNIKKRLNGVYRDIQGENGIISFPVDGVPISQLSPYKPDNELIKFYIKRSMKNNFFPQEAWNLAKKNDENRLIFEHEYAKEYVKFQISWLKKYDEIKPMYYAIYRDCVIGVSSTKKALMSFCEQHYPEIYKYLTLFKA